MDNIIAMNFLFINLCYIFEKIAKAKGLLQKERILKQYFETFDSNVKQSLKKSAEVNYVGGAWYSYLRFFVPKSDNGRDVYGIQITTMGHLYVQILNLSSTSPDYLKLKNKKSIKGCADYADIVYSVMKDRCREEKSNLNLTDINDMLDIIAGNDRRATEIAFSKFIERASALEQKWVIRLILKKLHIGLSDQKILRIYHPKAQDFFNSNSNLSKLCEWVANGAISVCDAVTNFQHIRPMLCERILLKDLKNELDSGEYFVEEKLDGERFQLHYSGDIFMYISRNGKDYTKNFGKNASEGNLTPLIQSLFSKKIEQIILDGEMMVWDKEAKKYLTKGENIDVKSLKYGSNLRPCFVVYDILQMNGTNYMDHTYLQRSSVLDSIIKGMEGVLVRCKYHRVKNKEEFQKYFNDIINEAEGVVLKHKDSVYKPGSRTGGWIKIKSDYIDGLTVEMDLIIIGGFYNRANKFINKYIVGVVQNKVMDHEYHLIHSFAIIESGLGFEQQKYINSKLDSHWLPFDSRSIEESYTYIKWGILKPNVWIKPQNSLILEIKATELHPSTSFYTAYTLRFPRVIRIRDDKLWFECFNMNELDKLCKSSGGVHKMHKRGIQKDDFECSPGKKRKLNKEKAVDNVYLNHICENDITKVSKVFEGKDICVLSTSKGKPSIGELKRILIKHGARIVENPSTNMPKSLSIAGDLTVRVKQLINKGLYNILSIDWIIRGFFNDDFDPKYVQPKPSDIIYATKDIQEQIRKYYDEYDDPYFVDLSMDELKDLLNRMDTKVLPIISQKKLIKLDNKLRDNGKFYNIFNRCIGYFFDENNSVFSAIKLSELIFYSRGGYCYENIERSLNEKSDMVYFFIDIEESDIMRLKNKLNLNIKCKSIKILSYKWIIDSDKESLVKDQCKYIIYEKHLR